MNSSHTLREGARPEVVRDNVGHANICVTHNVYGKSWREERVNRSPKLSAGQRLFCALLERWQHSIRQVFSTSFRNQMDAGSWDKRRG
jgi:hypothetical protein